MRYADVEAFLKAGLAPDYSPVPIINPGPATAGTLQKLSPQALIFATVGGGAGMTVEEAYDRPFITIRAIGPQNDYTAAEDLAYAIDTLLLRVDHPQVIGSTRVLYIVRAGAAPSLIDYDTASRYHFQCTYITEAKSGV